MIETAKQDKKMKTYIFGPPIIRRNKHEQILQVKRYAYNNIAIESRKIKWHPFRPYRKQLIAIDVLLLGQSPIRSFNLVFFFSGINFRMIKMESQFLNLHNKKKCANNLLDMTQKFLSYWRKDSLKNLNKMILSKIIIHVNFDKTKQFFIRHAF